MGGTIDEFRLIADLFAPLARSYPGALGLTDDVAIIASEPGTELVVTTDTIVAGVHFLGDTPPALIARKLVGATVSDLAAKGASPFAVLLAATIPKTASQAWFAAFAEGLGQGLSFYGCALVGGDTVASPGPVTLSLTAFGRVPQGGALLRRGARPGDTVWVSGTIGDGALGLAVAQGGLIALEPAHRAHLLDRYQVPRARVTVGRALRGVAHASMDISDGLVQDLGHLCSASGVAARISVADIPLSAAAQTALAADKDILASILAGGDDYELLFSAPPEARPAMEQLSIDLDVPLTAIGRIVEGRGVTVTDGAGQPLALGQAGWRHFISTVSEADATET
jgi:thiamine-monophosphate kinase